MTATVSLVLPTHRTTYSAIARAMELASLDENRFEVVISDNSRDPRKRALLECVNAPAVKLHFSENQGPFENAREALRLTTGEFVLLIGDDDWFSARGLRSLSDLASKAASDLGTACITGTYLIESLTGPRLFSYDNLDAWDSAIRIQSYITTIAPNVLYYSLVRRELILFCTDVLASFPYKLSYHDQLMSLLYLAHGRTIGNAQLVYCYDIAEWETWEKSLSKDRAIYAAAGLPAEVDRLQWLLCGLEGALLLRSQLVKARTGNDGCELAEIWLAGNIARFRQHHREYGYMPSSVNLATAKLKEKYMACANIELSELLLDVTDVFELIDGASAQRYFAYWSNL